MALPHQTPVLFLCCFRAEARELEIESWIGCGTTRDISFFPRRYLMGLMPDTKNCGLHMRRECRERFPWYRGLAIPTCITARASRMCRFLSSRWRVYRSRHSRRMQNPQFCVSGKRPIEWIWHVCWQYGLIYGVIYRCIILRGLPTTNK